MLSCPQVCKALGFQPVRWATKMQGGVTKNKKDSAGRRLGIKLFGGQEVGYNKILVRQRGFKWKPGFNVFVGKDHTIHSAAEGYVYHEWDPVVKRTVVSVVPMALPKRPWVHPAFCYHHELYPDRAVHNPAPSHYVRPTVQSVKTKRDIGKLIKPAGEYTS